MNKYKALLALYFSNTIGSTEFSLDTLTKYNPDGNDSKLSNALFVGDNSEVCVILGIPNLSTIAIVTYPKGLEILMVSDPAVGLGIILSCGIIPYLVNRAKVVRPHHIGEQISATVELVRILKHCIVFFAPLSESIMICVQDESTG